MFFIFILIFVIMLWISVIRTLEEREELQDDNNKIDKKETDSYDYTIAINNNSVKSWLKYLKKGDKLDFSYNNSRYEIVYQNKDNYHVNIKQFDLITKSYEYTNHFIDEKELIPILEYHVNGINKILHVER